MTESHIKIYQSEDGKAEINVQLYNDTIWLSLNQMVNLFERDKSVVSMHINNIYKEKELLREATIAKYATVQNEGDREVERAIVFFNLDVIISVGYRIKSIIIMGILSGILSLFGCVNKTNKSESFIQQAKQIEIVQLSGELKLLEQKKTEFDFFGITSNGIDCIYFVRDNGKFQIEFEAMTDNQIPYIDKLKTFATQNGFEIQMTTYGNKPHYDAKEAPVLKIITNSNIEKTAEIGQKIQKDIFNNKADTKYDIVP